MPIYNPFNCNAFGGMVVVTTDGGAGSSGKGSLNSWLADRYGFHLATNNWMSNAGHFTELDNGTRILVQHIPSAFVNPNVELYINAGAAIDLEILYAEITMLEELGYQIHHRLTIHPNANVITAANKQLEKDTIKTGSTFKGCGASVAAKAMRLKQQKLAKDYEELEGYIKDRTMELNAGVARGMRILIEGSQGMDLDLNHAEYPFTTSRQTHPTQLVADAGLPCQAVTNVIVNLRTNPIRISNESAATGEQCYTGNYWDAKEIGWEAVAKQAGYDDFHEFVAEYKSAMMTSVTKKVRRIFEWPKKRFAFIHAMAGGLLTQSHLLYSLNFVNFVDRTVKGVRTEEEVMTPKVVAWLHENFYPTVRQSWENPATAGPTECKLRWIRTGPRHSDIVEL